MVCLVNTLLDYLHVKIVLDKSYLDAATKGVIENLCGEYRVLMTDTLFYELITTKDESRQRCFAKFPRKENPVVLIPNIGTLLRYENDNKKPTGKLYQHRIKITFMFNSDLADGSFKFDEDMSKNIERDIKERKEETQGFVDRVESIAEIFPDLAKCSAKELSETCDSIKNDVVDKMDLVKAIYNSTLGHSNLPITVPSENIGKKWAIYRWLQVQLMYAIDLYKKYNGKIPDTVSEPFWNDREHDLLDAHYIVLGVLCGALATKDKNIIEYYKLLHPKGVLLN